MHWRIPLDLKTYLETTNTTMTHFAAKIERAQSIVSRLSARKHYPDQSTAVNIVIATRGAVTMDELYDVPKKYRARQ